jgi:hypothetical protein
MRSIETSGGDEKPLALAGRGQGIAAHLSGARNDTPTPSLGGTFPLRHCEASSSPVFARHDSAEAISGRGNGVTTVLIDRRVYRRYTSTNVPESGTIGG